MHIHNVADYAPPGYRLERSDTGSGGCQHRFVAEGLPELVCEGSWTTAEEERAALERFRGAHEPLVSTPWLVHEVPLASIPFAEQSERTFEERLRPAELPPKPKAAPKGKR